MRGEDSCRGMIPAATLLDMAEAVEKVDSVRLTRFDTKRLVWALVLSLMLHFLAWGGYEWGKKTGLWQRLHWPTRQHLAQKKPPTLVVQEAEPSIFLDVDPDQVSPEAPKDAKYYSSKNSRAANPDADKDLKQPKLDGKQTDVPKTKDVPRTQNTKPTPPTPQPQPQKETQPAQPKPTELTGDMKLAKLETSPEKTEDKPERPRTVREALAQQMALRPSRAMQQEGGVSRRMTISSLDAKETPFGKYDEALVDSISQCWFDYLDRNSYAYDRLGKVVVAFRLHSDGRVTDVKLEGDTVDDKAGGIWAYICQASVDKAAPFAPWPSDLVRLNQANYRDVTFQFNY